MVIAVALDQGIKHLGDEDGFVLCLNSHGWNIEFPNIHDRRYRHANDEDDRTYENSQ